MSECYTPVAGKVVEVNESVKENPSLINKQPMNDGNFILSVYVKIFYSLKLYTFYKGWLIKLDLTNKVELDKLMTQKQYDEYLKSEDH